MPRCQLPADPTSPYASRQFATRALRSLNQLEPPDLGLALSELVTNAVMHGVAPITVALRLQEKPQVVYVEVVDSGRWKEPDFGHDDPTVPGGQGLRIVAALVQEWGVTGRPRAGSCVWFTMPLAR